MDRAAAPRICLWGCDGGRCRSASDRGARHSIWYKVRFSRRWQWTRQLCRSRGKGLPAVIAVTTSVPILRHGAIADRSFDFGGSNQDTPEGVPMPGVRKRGKAQITAVGSGFFISPDGYAVTNSHVLQNSNTAEVRTQDEQTYTAKVVGKDPISDLALIKVDGRNDFSYVAIADELPRVGDWVLAVGNPFGLGGTVTAGIVSARHRNFDSASSEDLIQIDAPINRGESGGPSFDSNGNVIGVNTMIASPSGGSVGIAFAVPAETIKTVIPPTEG